MKEIKPITITQLGNLGVDDSGQLYWNGQPVITETRVRLTLWVNISIIVSGLSAAIIAILSIVNFLTGAAK